MKIKINYISLRFISILAICLVMVAAARGEQWKLHPSFDRTPVRIIDTPNNTYFLAHQQIYNKNINGYDFPTLTLFQYKKSNPTEGITPLVHDVNLSSADIRIVEYSPKGDYLTIVYNDGGIDFLNSSQQIVHIDRLKKSSVPGMAVISAVTFEPSTGDAWVATDAGYMHVSAGDFKIKELALLNKKIDRVCRFGEKIVVVADNAIWECNSLVPEHFNEFKQIQGVGYPSALLPLSDTEFGYVHGAPGAWRALRLVKLENDAWKASDLASDSFYSFPANETVVQGYECNFIPNKQGYLAYSYNKAWQLYAPTADNSAKLVSINIDMNPIVLGSWDFNNFWAYRDRGTFVPRHAEYTFASGAVSATATWTDLQSPLRPDAPAAFLCTHMEYSPSRGMLAMNHGQEWDLGYNAPVNPPLLSSHSTGGKWQVLSQVYTVPKSVLENQNFSSKYYANINRFPLADPNGLLVDPVNPNWIACGSMFGGIMFQDITDIDKDVLRFASAKDRFSDFPGFFAVTPDQTWDTMSSFSAPSCDNTGVMWSMFCNMFEAGGSSAKSQLKYIDPQQRAALYNAGLSTVSSIDNWHTINIPVDYAADFKSKVVACRHENNNNVVVIGMNNYDGEIVILDHNGTLDNTDDDVYKIFKKIKDEHGAEYNFECVNDITEDPVTGKIIVATNKYTLSFDPRQEVEEESIAGCTLRLEGGTPADIIPESTQINRIIFDDANRMWLGTHSQGVIGVSADRRNVVARYNTSNSPIPSDRVYGLGWNPASNSLMISTTQGMAEVLTDAAGTSTSVKEPYLSISAVRPDYNGNVEIRNVLQNTPVAVCDKMGTILFRLDNSNSGILNWNLTDSKGARVSAGTYKILVGENNPLELIVF